MKATKLPAGGAPGPPCANEQGDIAAGADAGIDFALIELFFFAYRDFTSDPDHILAAYGFGRAHHRVLYFVDRQPGLTVAELLDVLRITKQSLARVLKQLIDAGHIVQMRGPRDRRQRELHTTNRGRALALALSAPQSRRIAAALAEAGIDNRETIERFMSAMLDPDTRSQVIGLARDRDVAGQKRRRSAG